MSTVKSVNIQVSSLRNAELAQFITRFLHDLKQENLDFKKEEVLSALVKKLEAALPSYQSSLGQIRGSEKSAAIYRADELRDEDIQALRDGLKAYRTSKREAEKAAYTSLKLLLDQYKDIQRKHYEEETALISNLLERLASQKYQEQIETLALKKFVENLHESHQAFEQLFASRSQEQLQKVSVDVKKMRRDLLQSYQQLVDYTAILAQVKEDELYKKFLAVLNNSRKYYADLLAKRKSQSKETKSAPAV